MKIAVYTIALNEAHFIERWAKSCEEADYRLIVDTGSTDNTIEVAEALGCNTASIIVKPWRFDDARNAALALLPNDIDYCISLDADEVLMPGWRQAFEKMDPSVTRPRYKYVWSSNPDGSERLTFGGDKIHARHGYRWLHPIHETINPVGEEVQGWIDLDMRHYPDPTKSRAQYLPLLELSVREDPDDDRNLFYLGREYMFHGRNEEATKCLLKHLEMSKWPAERSTGMRYLAKTTGNKEHWLLRSCAEAPERREPWNDLSFYYYENSNWPACYSAAIRCLSIKDKPMEYLCEPEAWGSRPSDLASVAAWNMGIKNEAFNYVNEAIKLDPFDDRIRGNMRMMYKEMRTSDVCAIIPSKSNIDGLNKVVELLLEENSVKIINIIADGEDAYEIIKNQLKFKNEKINIFPVGLGDGIHVMWNKGIEHGYHNLFINDDVVFDKGAIDILASTLDLNKEIGIVCPNYDKRTISGYAQYVEIACPGNYDGTDGLAGFCMMLHKDLSQMWTFDERMKWYYGDNDVINWVILQGKKAAISGAATMELNPSWTTRNDPPVNFKNLIEQDRIIYEDKWNNIKKKSYEQYPIFIICRDRYSSTLDLINWIEKTGQQNIILVDNDSKYEPLLEYYEKTPHTVIRTGANNGHHVPWTSGAIEKFAKDNYFVVTDPDILPIEECPLDAIHYFRELLDRYQDRTKVGFGLKIDDLPDHYILKQSVIDHESQFWTGYMPEPNVIFANIDTTFALYKPNASVDIYTSIRTMGNYLARHTPWYVDSNNLSEEEIFYRSRLSQNINNWNK